MIDSIAAAGIPHAEKFGRLQEILRAHGKLAVAYSGGVDSVFLLKAAVLALGAENVLAITVRAENFPASEFRDAESFARECGVRHIAAGLDIFSIPGFAENSPERCYFCKKELFGLAFAIARENGFAVLADGANVDDLGDHRPGARAARELGATSPLQEAGLRKSEIRALLRHWSVACHAKPAYACLASRIPHGTRITPEALRLIEEAEEFFHGAGFPQVRVRVHGDVARVELLPEDRDRFVREGLWESAAEALRKTGFRYAALDFAGYKQGNMNAGTSSQYPVAETT